nr:4-alpha-glucanotransferase [Cupriavidus campinensis]
MGLSVQLYSLRRGAPTGLGDLTALALTCEAAAREGADAVAINPLHAGFAGLPARYSPYAPSSRIFHNALYADPAAVFGQDAVDQGIAALNIGHRLAAAEARDEIDWPTLSVARHALLRWLWDRHDTLLGADAQQAFAAFRARGGSGLLAHACFEAIQASLLAQARDDADDMRRQAASDWRQWPVTLRSPDSAAVAAFETQYPQEIGYHAFLQWLAAQGLETAQHRARAAGMAVGLIADLAVGTDPGGSHAWMRQTEILNGFHAGAPPDVYNPLGQDWGVAVFSPRGLRRNGYAAFIEMLRANLAHAGGLRIDHVLGLARMWLVPAGAPATAGAYLTYPLDDLLRLVAIESWRQRAIIIGENLGTVPETLNTALAARGVMGIDVLWFERQPADEDAGADIETDTPAPFLPPEQWPAEAVATTTTHDLPTIVGWWTGNDIAWRARLHQLGEGETEAGLMAMRAAERTALWQAMCAGGVVNDVDDVDGAEPDAASAPVEAVLRWLARARTPLRLVPVEDLLGAAEQPNLPGTVSGHPNWQRRLDADVRELFDHADVRVRVAAVRGTVEMGVVGRDGLVTSPRPIPRQRAAQRLDRQRLDEVRVEARRQRAPAVVRGTVSGQGEDARASAIDAGRIGPQHRQHLEAVHVRHLQVEQHHVRVKAARQFQRLRAAVGRPGVVAQHGQQFGHAVGGVGAVIHDQDAQPGAIGGRCARHGGAVHFHLRQDHGEGAAAPEPAAAGLDGAAMRLHHGTRQRQADAEPAARAIVALLREQVEDAVQRLRRDALPRVADGRDHVAALGGHVERNGAAAWRVLGGIAQQVGEHLPQPPRIGIDEDRAGGQREREALPRRLQRRPDGFHRRRDDVVDHRRHRLHLELARGDAAHVHQVGDQPRQQLQLAADDLGAVTGARVRRGHQADHVHGVADGRQRIAQLVGQDGEEGLHAPAGALQFLEPGLVRHIARRPQDAHRAAAGIAQQRLADMTAHQRAVLPLQARLAGPLAVGAHLAQRGQVMAAGHVLARVQQRDRPAHGLLRAVAEQRTRAAVPDADLAIEAEFAHRLLVQRIEQLLVARLYLPGALLGGVADGDIAVDHREAVRAPSASVIAWMTTLA